MKHAVFHIDKMDCPTEEQLIRKRLSSLNGIEGLEFDLLSRRLTVAHSLGSEEGLVNALDSLGLGARLEGADEGMQTSLFHVADLCCPTEEAIIRARLQKVEGITALSFSLLERQVSVTHSPHAEGEVVKALLSLQMGATQLGTTRSQSPENEQAPREVLNLRTRIVMGASGTLALAAEAVAYATGREDSWPVVLVAMLSIALGGRDTLKKGFVALKTFTLNINFLMTLAVLGAVSIGQWPEAAMVTFLFAVAELIEGLSLDRARSAIRGLLEMAPDTATVRSEEGVFREWREVPARSVLVGQIVRVKPGERIPLDGLVTAGASTVNQAPITGESVPVQKSPGDTVFAGSINERGTFEFEVSAASQNTTLARIIKAVQHAQGERAPTQRFIDTFARFYTPFVVVMALALAVIPPVLFSHAFQPWLYKALVLLVVACPCALVISTPVTVVSGLAAAARRGILVKGGVYLETGRKLRALALDKTGTLTHGKPVLTDVVVLERSYEKDALLHLAASLDVLSEHPVALSIVAAWTDTERRGASTLFPVSGFEAIPGRGVKGVIENSLYVLGNERLAQEQGVFNAHVETELRRLESEGKTAVVLMTPHKALAVFAVADTLKPTSREALNELHALGIHTVLLTGDNQTTASAIAGHVGISDARGNMLPEDKVAAINALRNTYGEVGMVGDGINDAPALAKSSIGFAMGAAGTDTAIETADVALMQDDLRKLPEFIRLSRKTGQILGQNIALALGIKVIFFALALTGNATLWMAVFADMGGSLLVVANGLRVLKPSPGSAS